MQIPKKYFHDRIVLLLLSINASFALFGSILILLRLDSGRSEGYIVQYRANLGLDAFKTGGVTEILSFIAFFATVVVLHTALSIRVYHIRRHLSTAVLAMGVLLLAVGIIVSNALLELR